MKKFLLFCVVALLLTSCGECRKPSTITLSGAPNGVVVEKDCDFHDRWVKIRTLNGELVTYKVGVYEYRQILLGDIIQNSEYNSPGW